MVREGIWNAASCGEMAIPARANSTTIPHISSHILYNVIKVALAAVGAASASKGFFLAAFHSLNWWYYGCSIEMWIFFKRYVIGLRVVASIQVLELWWGCWSCCKASCVAYCRKTVFSYSNWVMRSISSEIFSFSTSTSSRTANIRWDLTKSKSGTKNKNCSSVNLTSYTKEFFLFELEVDFCDAEDELDDDIGVSTEVCVGVLLGDVIGDSGGESEWVGAYSSSIE